MVRILRGSKHLTANSFTHWAVWLSCTFGMAIIAYVIASGIPVFGGLVSLVGAVPLVLTVLSAMLLMLGAPVSSTNGPTARRRPPCSSARPC